MISAGGIFGAIWFALWFPFAVVTTAWFWKRRDIQPIKARSPSLVLMNDSILIVFVTLLCFQRMFGDEFPCLLTLWSGYVALITLADAYLWRCWTLYFVWNLTKCRINNVSLETIPFFIRNRHFISAPFLVRVLGTLNIAFLFPVALLTATKYDLLTTATMPGVCDKSWGSIIYAAYAGFYIVVFAFFAYTLRGVDDAFGVQRELKFTSLLLLVVFVLWFIFNFLEDLKQFNEQTFPISTLALLLGVFLAHGTSTVWPLYRSIRPARALAANLTTKMDKLDNLASILASPLGLKSFTEFLGKEFSVENIYFYNEVEEFRKEVLAQGHDKVKEHAFSIYDKYIVTDAPFQVSLPQPCHSDLVLNMTAYTNDPAIFKPPHPDDAEWAHHEAPTLFDWAAHTIFQVMETDSCPRYYRSELYTKLLEDANKKQHAASVMADMGVI